MCAVLLRINKLVVIFLFEFVMLDVVHRHTALNGHLLEPEWGLPKASSDCQGAPNIKRMLCIERQPQRATIGWKVLFILLNYLRVLLLTIGDDGYFYEDLNRRMLK